ncbi:MAG: NAD(P)/FAD-dependent oxidoreductase [Bdellovibrionota bacterium]
MSVEDKKKVAVIGAGPRGLAVAYQLIQDGYIPIVYEASSKPGGMSCSFDFSGIEIERFYHFHCTSDDDFFTLLEELHLQSKLHWVKTKMGFYFQGRVQAWGTPQALLLFSGLSLIAKLRYALHAFYATKIKRWKHLDSLLATEWVQKWIGKKAYDVLWRKLFELKFYEFADKLSAAWIWSRIRRIGLSRYNIFHEKLGYLEGGSATLIDALVDYIGYHGGKVYLESPVTKVHIKHDKVVGLEVNSKVQSFDHVISTVPLPYVSAMIPDFPEKIHQQYKQIDNVAVVCVIAKLRKSVSPYFWLNIHDPNMDIPGIVEYSNLRPMEESIVYIPYYMPGTYQKYGYDDAYFENEVTQYLQKINPSLQNEDFISIVVSRYRYAQPVCPPHFLQQLPPISGVFEGLWVADTSYYYPEDRGISESIGFGRSLAKKAVQ